MILNNGRTFMLLRPISASSSLEYSCPSCENKFWIDSAAVKYGSCTHECRVCRLSIELEQVLGVQPIFKEVPVEPKPIPVPVQQPAQIVQGQRKFDISAPPNNPMVEEAEEMLRSFNISKSEAKTAIDKVKHMNLETPNAYMKAAMALL